MRKDVQPKENDQVQAVVRHNWLACKLNLSVDASQNAALGVYVVLFLGLGSVNAYTWISSRDAGFKERHGFWAFFICIGSICFLFYSFVHLTTIAAYLHGDSDPAREFREDIEKVKEEGPFIS